MLGELFRDQFHLANFKLDHPVPEDFWISCWQTGEEICMLWILYRTCMALYFTSSLFYVISSFAMQQQNAGKEYKFLIFVTNLTFIVETVVFLLGFCIAVVAYAKQMRGQKPEAHIFCKIYWVLYTVLLPPSFLVTIGFWLWVYDGVIFPANAFNVILHITNAAFLLLDFCLVAVPYRFLHFYMPLIYILLYLSFSAIYELSGGTGVKGMRPIYKKLDWKYHPEETAVFAVCFLCGAIGIHAIASTLYVIKMWLRKKFILLED